MRYIAVDDELFALNDLESSLRLVEPECELVCFISPKKALDYANENAVDVAFLDVEMGSINGLVLAKKLKEVIPALHIIFVTGYEQYALGAIQLHATGYLLKPAIPEDLRRELTFIYEETPPRKTVRVQTFGGFDIFVGTKPLVFGRSKAKELLALLIDRQGSTVTAAEACAIIWEDDSKERKKKEYFRVLVKDIRKTLLEAGVEDILVRSYNSLAIRPERLQCDSYSFLAGDAKAVNRYRENYMPGYSWAEFTLGEMERRFNMITRG